MGFLDFLKENIVYFDGGMGTLLQEQGLTSGQHPEQWNLSHPEIITQIHQDYFDAGSNVVTTNTFGANLLKFDEKYQILLVVSTLTKDERDEELKFELQSRPNIKILDGFLPNIEEIYRLSDVYFFSVVEEGNCIDVPLSCIEAAACNIPVVSTRYGEMSAFCGKSGFWFIDSFDALELNKTVASALMKKEVKTRAAVLEYDWKNAVEYFENIT